MSYNIIATKFFKKELKRLAKKFVSLKTEYADLLNLLEENPISGTPLGNDCYKIRIAIASKGKGKSGGARVITYVLNADETIFLLSIYDKSELDNISDDDIANRLNNLE
jgi:mRNA-degrading endonuclease RelE of RelBE toxin-antitoxin system